MHGGGGIILVIGEVEESINSCVCNLTLKRGNLVGETKCKLQITKQNQGETLKSLMQVARFCLLLLYIYVYVVCWKGR